LVTAVRRRTSDRTVEAGEVANDMLDVADLLLNEALWISRLSADKAGELLKIVELVADNPVVSERNIKSVYAVYVYRFTDSSGLKRQELTVEVKEDVTARFRLVENPKTPIVVNIEDSGGYYSYPPRTFESLFFYLLNPEIEAEATRLIESLDVDAEARVAYEDFKTTMSSIPSSLSDVRIDLGTSQGNQLGADAIVVFSGLNQPMVLDALHAHYDDRIKYYKLWLNLEDQVAYAFHYEDENITKALELVLKKFATTKDLQVAKKVLSDVKATALRAYVAMNVILKLDSV